MRSSDGFSGEKSETTAKRFSSKKFYIPGLYAILPLLLGFFISCLLLLSINYFKPDNSKFEDLALGEGTTSYFASYNGFPIHCSDIDDAHKCIEGFKVRGQSKVVLWLGSSQVHAINQYKVGQKSMSQILFNRLKGHDLDLLTFSQPNANFQEHYLLFQYLKRHLPLDILILPAVFDDTRETGIRTSIMKAIEDKEVVSELQYDEIGKIIINNYREQHKKRDDQGVDDTIQKHSERSLNNILEKNIDLWKQRPEIRGNISIFIYKLRNRLFNITPSSKRQKIIGRYKLNMLALKSLIKSARKDSIHILVYISPIRNDVEIPYITEEYSDFKNEVEILANSNKSFFVNLENLVPSKYWGMKESTSIGNKKIEIDFMHFKEEGHYILANEIYRNIIKIIGDN